jgi:redox-sensing transcriptional repressor
MMPRTEIPDIVVGRLPLYLRALARLQLETVETTSSHELGQRLNISSAQIRKDLSHFGEFGKQGTGYNVGSLITELQHILHADRRWNVALVGIGDLGRALAHYAGFATRGFIISHLFDADPLKVGQQIDDLVIEPAAMLEPIIKQAGIKVAMIATPADEAQSVANTLIGAGVKSILNYAPISLSVPEGIRVQHIDPVIHLQRMVYYIE